MPGTSAGARKGWVTRRRNEAVYARVLASPKARPARPTPPLDLDYHASPQRIRDLYYGGYTPQPKAKPSRNRTERAKTAPQTFRPSQITRPLSRAAKNASQRVGTAPARTRKK